MPKFRCKDEFEEENRATVETGKFAWIVLIDDAYTTAPSGSFQFCFFAFLLGPDVFFLGACGIRDIQVGDKNMWQRNEKNEGCCNFQCAIQLLI